ncbi:hypothetical protein QUA62_26995 [Microcoleus sp. MON1_C1]|uniref:hypothetical protein n=1 Tax=Microcoleus sp. MON1_C1 TaxID=2818827 RepID=UPI002FD0F38D
MPPTRSAFLSQPTLHRRSRSSRNRLHPQHRSHQSRQILTSVIDVEVTTDTPAADELIEPAVKTAAANIETLLNKMSLADIRKLAKAKGADARGNRVNIAARLKKIVTESDIWDATA